MELGQQTQLNFDKDTVNYFVHYDGFNHEIMKAGLCFYSLREDNQVVPFRFNNTNYKVQSYKQLRIPFVHDQKGMNITLNLNQNQLDKYQSDQKIDTLQVQICGIYTDGEHQQEDNLNFQADSESNYLNNIPYISEIYQNQLNSLYFFQNSQENASQISQQKFYVNNLNANEQYSLSFNTVHLKGLNKVYPQFIIKYNIIVQSQDGEDPSTWEYPSELSENEVNELLNDQNENTQFLFTQGIDTKLAESGDKVKIGLAISVFYNFNSGLGRLYQPYVLAQIQSVQVKSFDGELNYNGYQDITSFVNDGESQDIQSLTGQFQNFEMFGYFYFKVKSSFMRISSTSEANQPSLQLCQFDQNQVFQCSQTFSYTQQELDNTTSEFYLIVSPSASTGISSLVNKKFKYGIQIFTNVFSFSNDKVYQMNLGNNNTFAIQNYDITQPYLSLKINFLGIQNSVPKTGVFSNGHIKYMDQKIYSCNQSEKIQCFKNREKNQLLSETTFTNISLIATLYTQTVHVPQDNKFFIVEQILYVLPKSASSNESQESNETFEFQFLQSIDSFMKQSVQVSEQYQDNDQKYQYSQYIGQVSETVKGLLQPTESGKPDHTLLLVLTLVGLFVFILGFVLYCVISQKLKKKRQEKLQENHQFRSSYRQSFQNQQENNQEQPLLKKDYNINNLTELDQNGNTIISQN